MPETLPPRPFAPSSYRAVDNGFITRSTVIKALKIISIVNLQDETGELVPGAYNRGKRPWFLLECHGWTNPVPPIFHLISDGEEWLPAEKGKTKEVFKLSTNFNPKKTIDLNGLCVDDQDLIQRTIVNYLSDSDHKQF